MTKKGYGNSNRLQSSAGIAKTMVIPLILAFSGLVHSEVYTGGEVKSYSGGNVDTYTGGNIETYSNEAVAVPQNSNELRIYKQAFEITADVICRVPKKGPSYCKTNIGSEIDYQVQPEMILKYKSVRLDDQEFATELTSTGELQFRTNKVDYSGSQTFGVEIIYLK